jgi:hypothetical protein
MRIVAAAILLLLFSMYLTSRMWKMLKEGRDASTSLFVSASSSCSGGSGGNFMAPYSSAAAAAANDDDDDDDVC